jgi:uncharacterized protein (TIGR00106 family)
MRPQHPALEHRDCPRRGTMVYHFELFRGDYPMNVLIDICVVPMGVGVSVSKYVVECQRIFEAAGLNHEMHSYGTNVEGEWDKVMAAVKQCHEKMHEMGAPRCGSTLRVGTRVDREQSMRDKLDSVYRKMEI